MHMLLVTITPTSTSILTPRFLSTSAHISKSGNAIASDRLSVYPLSSGLTDLWPKTLSFGGWESHDYGLHGIESQGLVWPYHGQFVY